jgi:hypothetical protein
VPCIHFFYPENYSHKSGAIFHINLYVFYIQTEIPNGTNKFNHVKRSVVFQNELLTIPHGRINHLCCHWNKRMLTIVQNTFYSQRTWWLPLVNDIHFFQTWTIAQNTFYSCPAHGFLSSMKGLSLTTWSLFSSFFFGLGVTNDAAKPNCVLPIGEDGSSYDDLSSGKLTVININETQLSWKKQLCQ